MKTDNIFRLFLLAIEVLFVGVIINKVAYTEIDWTAYMEQVSGFMNGERDYHRLVGGTGPLVYPAGFLYFFSMLYQVTDEGRNIQVGQYIFGFLMVATLAIVSKLYSSSKRISFYVTGLLLASKRIHSIFVLRLFNDPVAMLFMYASIYAIISKRWEFGSILFSLALSVKMNVLLFAPGFALIYYQCVGLYRSIVNAGLVVILQVGLGYPFLIANPPHYLGRAFELSRAFLFKWTVNWKFVPVSVFNGPLFSISLLMVHLILLLIFLTAHWTRDDGGVVKLFFTGLHGSKGTRKLDADHILLVLFTSNFIGIVCARSLHYQFYSWYFYTIPYLLWRTRFYTIVKLAIFFCIEVCWNIYPSNETSSLLLLVLHCTLLLGLLVGDRDTSKRKVQ